MDLLNRAFLQLNERLRAMTPGGRLMVILSAAALLGLGYLFAHPITTPDVDLMHGVPIAASQLPAMHAALAAANLKGYQVREEARGLAIYVPRGQEAEYMAALAKAKALPPELGAREREAASAGSPWDVGTQRDRERMMIAKQRRPGGGNLQAARH